MMKDDFDKMFGDFDENKIVLEVAYDALAGLYKGLTKAGLEPYEAAIIVTAMMNYAAPHPPQQEESTDDNSA